MNCKMCIKSVKLEQVLPHPSSASAAFSSTSPGFSTAAASIPPFKSSLSGLLPEGADRSPSFYEGEGLLLQKKQHDSGGAGVEGGKPKFNEEGLRKLSNPCLLKLRLEQ